MIDEMCLNDALLEGAQEVFKTMISGNIESCDSYHKIVGDSLLGSITFKGGLQGCLAIYCRMPCAKTIAVNMLAMDPSEELSEEEICDALGEVTNMVMDGVKSRIKNVAGDISVSIPMVVRGRGLQNSLGEGAMKTSIKLKFEDECIAELSMLYKESYE